MDTLILDFRDAYEKSDGYGVAACLAADLSKYNPPPWQVFEASLSSATAVKARFLRPLREANFVELHRGDEAEPWSEVFSAYWSALAEMLAAEHGHANRTKGDWTRAYTAWKTMAERMARAFQSSIFPFWAVPCLYVVGNNLRIIAMKADESTQPTGNISYDDIETEIIGSAKKHENLSDAVRLVNRMFSICQADRAPIEESKKWGLYYITNLLFKMYFKVNTVHLTKNLVRSLQASGTPPLNQFPMAHQVTFNYYMGMINFLEEDHEQAEGYLMSAWQMCDNRMHKNKELILTYLIPCHLTRTGQLPTAALLAPYPRLAGLFAPLAAAIRAASLARFDDALLAGSRVFVRRRVYLALESCRLVVLRNLMRRVFLAGGHEPPASDGAAPVRRTRIPIDEFLAAVRMSAGGGRAAMAVDRDEVECFIANLIYKDMMKGYIHRERGYVVLSKAAAFPGTGV